MRPDTRPYGTKTANTFSGSRCNNIRNWQHFTSSVYSIVMVWAQERPRTLGRWWKFSWSEATNVQVYNDNFEWTGKVYIGISLSCWTVAIMSHTFRNDSCLPCTLVVKLLLKQKEVRKVINIAKETTSLDIRGAFQLMFGSNCFFSKSIGMPEIPDSSPPLCLATFL